MGFPLLYILVFSQGSVKNWQCTVLLYPNKATDRHHWWLPCNQSSRHPAGIFSCWTLCQCALCTDISQLPNIWHQNLLGPVSHRSQVPSHLRSIHAISTVESMEVLTYHFTQGPKSQVTQGQSMQSQPLRPWKLGLTTSHGVPSPKSLNVNPCNLSRWDHGSWDLPLHTWSQVPSHSRSICAISVVESMEVGTYHFTRVPSPKSPSMTWMPTWQHFLKVRLGTCVESLGQAKT